RTPPTGFHEVKSRTAAWHAGPMATSSKLVTALARLAAGDREGALAAAGAGSTPLAEALSGYLRDEGAGSVYDRPAAFEAFIRGGGNIELYARTAEALAASYDTVRPAALLDIGCGDGSAVVAALARAGYRPGRV